MNPQFLYTATLDAPGRTNGPAVVSQGTLREAEAKAREIFMAQSDWLGPEATLRLTRGPNALFAKAIILRREVQS